MKVFPGMIVVLLSLPLASDVLAQVDGRAALLVEDMRVLESYQDSVAACQEKAGQHDVAADVAKTPTLLGGITPDDGDWLAARDLYLRMLKAGCAYDSTAPVAAFAEGLGEALSPSEIEGLIEFYRTPLGQSFVRASRVANKAAYRVQAPLPEAVGAYDAFAADLENLLERRAPEERRQADKPAAPKALSSMDDAMVLSNKMMQVLAEGNASEAINIGLPHSTIPTAKADELIQLFDQQKPIRDASYGGGLDYELIRNDTVHDALINAVFMHRFERHAMVWQFIWYRGKDGWLLSSIKYADDLTQLVR